MAGTTAYPAALDTNTNLNENLADNVDTVSAAHQNNQNAALKAIQAKVGIGADTATTTQMLVGGASAGSSAWVTMSGNATMTNAGVVSVTGGAFTSTLYVNETANGSMTLGLTVNQGANDDEIVAFKSSDIAHGYTTGGETDTYASMKKSSATLGGLKITSIAEDAAEDQVTQIHSIGGTAMTTKTTSGVGLVDIYVSEHDGANALADVTADGNIFSVRARVGSADLTRFMVDEDGDAYIFGAATVTGTVTAGGTVLTGVTATPALTEINGTADRAMYVNSSGDVTELALGASGTVLTSGGTTSAPTWEAAAGGGGSVSMTSSGSITAGNLVALSAANTVKTVTDSRVAMALNTNTTYTTPTYGSHGSSGMMWNGNSSPTVVMTWVSPNGSNWYIQAGTYSSNTVTWGTGVEIGAGTTWWYAGNGGIYDSVNGGYWTYAPTTGSPYKPYVNFNTVSGTSVTAGTPVIMANGGSYSQASGAFAYDSTNAKMVFCHFNAIARFVPLTVSGTTVTAGTDTYPANGSFKNPAIFWNSTYARLVVLGGNSSGNFEVCLRQYDSGTSSYTAQTINTITHLDEYRGYSPPNYANGTQGFDMGSNQYVQVGTGSDQYLRITNFTLNSATTGTMGITSIFDGTTGVSATGTGVGQSIKLGLNGDWSGSYNIAQGTLVIVTGANSTDTPLYIYTLRYNAATNLWSQAGAALAITGDGSGGTDIIWAGSGASTQIIDSGGNHRVIGAAFRATNAAGTYLDTYVVATPSSGTTDARDVIGIAQSTVGTGVSVDVTVNGGINENVSGLTSGTDYYIQGTGALATTADSIDYGKLGRAIATDKLLITGIGDPTVSNR